MYATTPVFRVSGSYVGVIIFGICAYFGFGCKFDLETLTVIILR